MSVCVPICSIRPAFITTIRSRDRERLGLVVRDVDRGLPRLPLEVEDRVLERVPKVLVERREGLVEEQHPRVGGQHAGERHALLLPAGQLGRQARAVAGQPTSASISSTRSRIASFFWPFTDSPKPTLSATREMREQRRRLEDEADVPLARWQLGDVLVVEVDPAGGRLDQPRDHAQAWSSCRSPTARAA